MPEIKRRQFLQFAGSQIVDPNRDVEDGLNSTLVPIDSPVSQGFPDQGGPVQDIMGHTLFLLMYALKTEHRIVTSEELMTELFLPSDWQYFLFTALE